MVVVVVADKWLVMVDVVVADKWLVVVGDGGCGGG
jgi:hypothetical protein